MVLQNRPISTSLSCDRAGAARATHALLVRGEQEVLSVGLRDMVKKASCDYFDGHGDSIQRK